MDHSPRSEPVLIFAGLVVLASACQKQSAPKAPANTPSAQATTPTLAPAAGPDTTLPQPKLTVVSPDTIVTAHHKAQVITFQVQYTITKPALVKRAVLQLSNDAVGVIDSVVLPAQSEGTGTWSPSKPLSIGPLVLFSAHCSAGDTPLFVWGAAASPTNISPAIITVTPTHVPAAASDDPAHADVPVTLWGNGLGSDCTVKARIDRRTVPLVAKPEGANRLGVVVKRHDLGPDPIYTRWFTLTFILRGPKAGTQSVAKVPVAVAE